MIINYCDLGWNKFYSKPLYSTIITFINSKCVLFYLRGFHGHLNFERPAITGGSGGPPLENILKLRCKVVESTAFEPSSFFKFFQGSFL